MNTLTLASNDSNFALHDYSIKFVLIGDLCVGKTTFLNTFLSGHFTPSTKNIKKHRGCTNKIVEVGGKRILLQIWDTEGQEKYRSLTASYYRGAHGCLILYDVTNMSTFENVKNWFADLQEYTSAMSDISTVLVGMTNQGRERVVSRDLGELFGIGHNMPYMEVDAKNEPVSVNAVVYRLIAIVLESVKRNSNVLNIVRPIHITSTTSTSNLVRKQWCSC